MMSNQNTVTKKVFEEIEKFEKRMEEIHLLKLVARDLRSYGEMIKIKKYD